MNKPKTFEDYLIDRHTEQYSCLDDEMGDNCSEWIANLDVHTLIAYAECYASEKVCQAATELGNKWLASISASLSKTINENMDKEPK